MVNPMTTPPQKIRNKITNAKSALFEAVIFSILRTSKCSDKNYIQQYSNQPEEDDPSDPQQNGYYTDPDYYFNNKERKQKDHPESAADIFHFHLQQERQKSCRGSLYIPPRTPGEFAGPNPFQGSVQFVPTRSRSGYTPLFFAISSFPITL